MFNTSKKAYYKCASLIIRCTKVKINVKKANFFSCLITEIDQLLSAPICHKFAPNISFKCFMKGKVHKNSNVNNFDIVNINIATKGMGNKVSHLFFTGCI